MITRNDMKGLLLALFLTYFFFIQTKAQARINRTFTTSNDVLDTIPCTGGYIPTLFVLNESVYEKNGFIYNGKTNKLLSDTILFYNFSLVLSNLYGYSGVPGTVKSIISISNGVIYKYQSKMNIDSSFKDTIKLYHNPYSANLVRTLYYPTVLNDIPDKKYYSFGLRVFPNDYQAVQLPIHNPISVMEYPNGKLKGVILIGKRFDTLTRYYPNGNIAEQASYKYHRLSREITYFKNGFKKSKGKWYLGQLEYYKEWGIYRKKHFLSSYEKDIPLLLLDSSCLKYVPTNFDSTYYKRNLWLSIPVSAFRNRTYLMKEKRYYNNFGKTTFHWTYNKDTLVYIHPKRGYGAFEITYKKVVIFNFDTIQHPYLKNKKFYYDKNGRLLAKDINYTKSSGKKNIRFVYPKKGKAIKQVYDETTSKYLPVK